MTQLTPFTQENIRKGADITLYYRWLERQRKQDKLEAERNYHKKIKREYQQRYKLKHKNDIKKIEVKNEECSRIDRLDEERGLYIFFRNSKRNIMGNCFRFCDYIGKKFNIKR